jgi:hypothetical protein
LNQIRLTHEAREANLAMAVLSYLKMNRLDQTAQSFLEEWHNVHGTKLANENIVMGTIVWQPLISDPEYPCFSLQGLTSPSLSHPAEETGMEENRGQVDKVPPSSSASSTPFPDDPGGREQTIQAAWTTRSALRQAPSEVGVRRSVSFDGAETQVRHIPRYTEDVKQDCFYNKIEIDSMRFDSQLEKQREQTENLLKFVEMSSEIMKGNKK